MLRIGSIQGYSTAWARALVSVVVAVCALAIFASHAGAATPGTQYGLVTSFGAGELNSGVYYTNGVAVDPTSGDILVSDTFGELVHVYAPDPVTGGTVLDSVPTVAAPTSLSVDPGDGAIYVSSFYGGVGVHKFDTDGAPVPTYAEDPTFSPLPFQEAATAVDPITHDLLLATSGQVDRFSSTGAFLSSFDGSDTRTGKLLSPTSIAVAPNGDIYVVEHRGGSERVERFDAAGHSLGRVPTEGVPTSVAVNPTTGEAVVSSNLPVGTRPFLEGYTATGTPTFHVRYPAVATAGTDHGLAIDAAGRIYAYVTAGGEDQVLVFDRATQPGVDAPQVSQITGTSVHLTGTLAPGGVSTTAHFEYCPVSADCADFPYADSLDPSDPWVTAPDQPGLTGSGPVTIEEGLTGLAPNQGYLVRLYATNEGNVENESEATSFATSLVAPIVHTGSASAVEDTSAALSGTIDARGAQTTYHFEYGTTTGYGAQSPESGEAIVGGSRSPREVSRSISGLLAGTTYHFRLVATNAGGTTAGADQTFTTLPSAAPVRGYEQVSPVDKEHGAIGSVLGFQAQANGDGIAYAMDGASEASGGAPLIPFMMSRRSATNWLDWLALDPPLGTLRGPIQSGTLAVSSDFTHTFVASNRALSGDATEGAANLYVQDLSTGAYRLVASSTAPNTLINIIGANINNTYIAGAPDFSWVVFMSQVPLIAGAPKLAMYRWSVSSGLSLESRLPDGSIPTGDFAVQGLFQTPVRWVSDDGSTYAFALASGETGVYRGVEGTTAALSVSRIPGDPTTPQPGTVLGISRNGESVMFTSTRLLPSAPVGEKSIYLYEAATNELLFVSAVPNLGTTEGVTGVSDDAHTVYFLNGSGTAVWRNGTLRTFTAEGPGVQAFMSPDGRYFAWLGQDGDVHLYDADVDQVSCASCRGGEPVGGANLADTTRYISNYRPLVVNDAGMVFFDSKAQLVPADDNSASDVYEFQNGRVTLISPGTGPYTAHFADATDDGSDVFFATPQRLVEQDEDDAMDIYDARIGGGIAAQSPVLPAPCVKTSCSEPAPGPLDSPRIAGSEQVTPSSSATAQATRAKVTITVRKVWFTAQAMHVRFTVSQSGRARVAGSHLATTVRKLAKAGTYTLLVPLDEKARSLARVHRRFTVTAELTVSGPSGTASKKLSHTLDR